MNVFHQNSKFKDDFSNDFSPFFTPFLENGSYGFFFRDQNYAIISATEDCTHPFRNSWQNKTRPAHNKTSIQNIKGENIRPTIEIFKFYKAINRFQKITKN